MNHIVDVVIPTMFSPSRHFSLIHQIKSALHQGVPARVVILCSLENYPKRTAVEECLSVEEKQNLTYFLHPDGQTTDSQFNPKGYMCAPAQKAWLEKGDAAEWQMHAADDDCLTPWALPYLLANSMGVDMVIGRGVVVGRDYSDQRHYRMGESVERCHVGLACGILKTASIRKLDDPIFDPNTGYSDWELIYRMAGKFPHRFIKQIVVVMGLTIEGGI